MITLNVQELSGYRVLGAEVNLQDMVHQNPLSAGDRHCPGPPAREQGSREFNAAGLRALRFRGRDALVARKETHVGRIETDGAARPTFCGWPAKALKSAIP